MNFVFGLKFLKLFDKYLGLHLVTNMSNQPDRPCYYQFHPKTVPSGEGTNLLVNWHQARVCGIYCWTKCLDNCRHGHEKAQNIKYLPSTVSMWQTRGGYLGHLACGLRPQTLKIVETVKSVKWPNMKSIHGRPTPLFHHFLGQRFCGTPGGQRGGRHYTTCT